MALQRVLVANRGEIAVRVIRACRELGIETVLAVSAADRESLGARLADRVVCIGPPAADSSYLDIEALIATALGTCADAIHPGYGFLAERGDFARACEQAGVIFIGPSADVIDQMGDKLRARAIAGDAGVPVVPGSKQIDSDAEALSLADRIGYPVLLKASAGGGGRGIKVVSAPEDMIGALELVRAEVLSAFGDATVYLERFISSARHIEVQVLADDHGGVISLGERDCSLQRRFQKMVEESPAMLPSLDRSTAEKLRSSIQDAAVMLTRQIGYRSAGTVEFIVDQLTGDFFFMEMNTRIQVEHPVTEQVTGVDLVAEQLRIAGGGELGIAQHEIELRGHAIECRITAEDPSRNFQPSPGRITKWITPGGPGVRVDTHCHTGYVVPPHYDSMLAKLIVHGRDREQAICRLRGALSELEVEGIETTVDYLSALIARPEFIEGRYDTKFVERTQENAR